MRDNTTRTLHGIAYGVQLDEDNTWYFTAGLYVHQCGEGYPTFSECWEAFQRVASIEIRNLFNPTQVTTETTHTNGPWS